MVEHGFQIIFGPGRIETFAGHGMCLGIEISEILYQNQGIGALIHDYTVDNLGCLGVIFQGQQILTDQKFLVGRFYESVELLVAVISWFINKNYYEFKKLRNTKKSSKNLSRQKGT